MKVSLAIKAARNGKCFFAATAYYAGITVLHLILQYHTLSVILIRNQSLDLKFLHVNCTFVNIFLL